MPSAFFIGGPAHELKCSDSYITARARIRSQPWLVAKDESEREVRNRRDLPESAHFQGSEKRQVVPLPLGGESDGAAQHVRREMNVRIGENKPFALRLFEPRHQGVRFPN